MWESGSLTKGSSIATTLISLLPSCMMLRYQVLCQIQGMLKPRELGELRKPFGSLRLMLKVDNAEMYAELIEMGNYKSVKEGIDKIHCKWLRHCSSHASQRTVR